MDARRNRIIVIVGPESGRLPSSVASAALLREIQQSLESHAEANAGTTGRSRQGSLPGQRAYPSGLTQTVAEEPSSRFVMI